MNAWIVRVEPPKNISRKQRDLLSQILLRTAKAFVFLGMEDWTASVPPGEKILGIEAEFHDLARFQNTSSPFILYFAKERDGKIFAKLLTGVIAGLKISSPRKQGKKDWMREWRKHYKPVLVRSNKEKLWIIPAWQKVPLRAKSALKLKIYPGQAFGTGTHSTTKLCLELFLSVAGKLPQGGCKIWDFGAGTGILAIAAGKWAQREKRKVQLVATEIDPVAREQCGKNARVNRIALVINGKAEKAQTYQLVFANVLAPVLLREKKVLGKSLAPGSYLVLSGLLQKEIPDFLPKFLAKNPGLEFLEERVDKEWSALLLRKV